MLRVILLKDQMDLRLYIDGMEMVISYDLMSWLPDDGRVLE